MPSLEELLHQYGSHIKTPTIQQQQCMQLVQKGYITEANPYLRLHNYEQTLVVVLQRFVWIWWPGVALTRHVDRDAIDTQPNHFRDLCAMRAVNIFTREVLSDEILHLKVFYTFYSLMGTEGGAKTLDFIFCFHVRMGGAIPTSYDGLRRLAIRMLLFAHSQDNSDSSDSGVVEEED